MGLHGRNTAPGAKEVLSNLTPFPSFIIRGFYKSNSREAPDETGGVHFILLLFNCFRGGQFEQNS